MNPFGTSRKPNKIEMGDVDCPVDGGRSGDHRRQRVQRHAPGRWQSHRASGFCLGQRQQHGLAQRKVDDKSNEITAIPQLLRALELSGTVVTIDAMGCQKATAEKIAGKKADYILAVKENQPLLLDDIKDSFQVLAAAVSEQIDCGYGRVERRTCSVFGDLSLLEKPAEWAALRSLVRIRLNDSTKPPAYLSARSATTSAAIRRYWSIENKTAQGA